MYEGLTEKGRKVWMFLERGIREGKTFNQIIREMRELGLGYRRKDMLHDLRTISKALGKFDWLQRMPPHRIIDEEVVVRASKPTVKRFLVTFEVKLYDPETSSTLVKYFTIGSDYKQPLEFYKRALIDSLNSQDFVDLYKNYVVSAKPVRAIGWW